MGEANHLFLSSLFIKNVLRPMAYLFCGSALGSVFGSGLIPGFGLTDWKSVPVSAPDRNWWRGQNFVPEQSVGPLEHKCLFNPEIIDLINDCPEQRQIK